MTKRTEPQREWGLTEDQHNMVTDVVATWRGKVDDLTAQLAAKQERIAALEAQLAQQGEWMPVPDGIYQGFEVNAEGSEILTVTNDVHGIEWDANIMLPDDVRLCRLVDTGSAGAEGE